MRKLFLLVAVVLLLAGCAGGKKSDPFVGTWKSALMPSNEKVVIRHTDRGYGYTLVFGKHSNGWFPLKRTSADTLFGEVKILRPNGKPAGGSFKLKVVLQSATGHLLVSFLDGTPTVAIHRVSTSTLAPPTAPATPDQEEF